MGIPWKLFQKVHPETSQNRVKPPSLHVFLEYLSKYSLLHETWLVVGQFRVAGYDGDIFRYIEDVFGRLNVRKTQKFVKNMIFKTKNQDLKRKMSISYKKATQLYLHVHNSLYSGNLNYIFHHFSSSQDPSVSSW